MATRRFIASGVGFYDTASSWEDNIIPVDGDDVIVDSVSGTLICENNGSETSLNSLVINNLNVVIVSNDIPENPPRIKINNSSANCLTLNGNAELQGYLAILGATATATFNDTSRLNGGSEINFSYEGRVVLNDDTNLFGETNGIIDIRDNSIINNNEATIESPWVRDGDDIVSDKSGGTKLRFKDVPVAEAHVNDVLGAGFLLP